MYHGKTPNNIISTFHDDATYVGSKAGKTLVKPVCVRDYNNTMGGIDLKDQKLSMYLLERKRGLKWYIKIFKRLLNVSILNGYIICAIFATAWQQAAEKRWPSDNDERWP